MEKNFWKLYNLLIKEKPNRSDAIIWLQGDRYDRAESVLKAYNSRLAEKIVISGNNVLIGHGPRIEENNISLEEMEGYLLKEGLAKGDLIIDNNAFNTRDQAIHIINLAEQNGWKSIILVSSAYNQPRALLTFLKQREIFNFNLIIYNYPIVMGMEDKPGGREKSVKEMCLEEEKKIEKYGKKGDLVSLKAGINYLKSIKQ